MGRLESRPESFYFIVSHRITLRRASQGSQPAMQKSPGHPFSCVLRMMLVDVNSYLTAIMPVADQFENQFLRLVLWAGEFDKSDGGLALVLVPHQAPGL